MYFAQVLSSQSNYTITVHTSFWYTVDARITLGWSEEALVDECRRVNLNIDTCRSRRSGGAKQRADNAKNWAESKQKRREEFEAKRRAAILAREKVQVNSSTRSI